MDVVITVNGPAGCGKSRWLKQVKDALLRTSPAEAAEVRLYEYNGTKRCELFDEILVPAAANGVAAEMAPALHGLAQHPDAPETPLLRAARRLYEAGHWKIDGYTKHSIADQKQLWADLRDAAGFAPGQSHRPPSNLTRCVLELAALTFEDYAAHHEASGNAESDRKARRNRAMAALCRREAAAA